MTHDNPRYDNPNWWRRIGERWGVEMVIRMAQRVAAKEPDGPNVIHNYTEWRADYVKSCSICGHYLDTGSVLDANCGGDCLLCMVECGDPDARSALEDKVRNLEAHSAA